MMSRWLWRLTTAAFVVAGGALASASISEWRLTLPKPREVARDVVIRHVADQHGRRASFRILLFSDEFRWRMNSHLSLENGVAEPDFTTEMRAVLNTAEEVICVGVSSEESAGTLPPQAARAEEERRAGRRASQIALWVRRALTNPVPVRKLNIGQHVRTTPSAPHDTSDQRRVVIVLVLESDTNVDINEALRTAMQNETVRAPIFGALLKDYSLSGETRFTWES